MRLPTDDSAWARRALEHSALTPLWLDSPDRPAPRPQLDGHVDVDLLVVGGGFTGLWTALMALERQPGRRVMVIEAGRIAEQASGRNGGICLASVAHGDDNAQARWPHEFDTLQRLGEENLDGIEATVERYGIDCGFVRAANLQVATNQVEVDALDPSDGPVLDAASTRRHVNSPTYLAGRYDPRASALVDPARLAWGLARAAEQLGARIAEHTRLGSITRQGSGVRVDTDGGRIIAGQVVLATNAFRSPLRRLRLATVPVYDYVLATEPLSDEQRAKVGWDPRVWVFDGGNLFHYYRLTPDGRILWGGYDAIYHFGRSIRPSHEDRRRSFLRLAGQFEATFPQLDDIAFTHRWGGVIDTSTRFCAFYGTAHGGRTAYAAGFTGLGVCASRFAADVMLDLLAGQDSERTRLEMVRTRPMPFPPEPLAWPAIALTQWSLERHDRTGRRNLWLKVLDRLGLGFAS